MRTLNWSVRLAEWAKTVVGKPFVWGETDCGSLLREAQCIIHGDDITGFMHYHNKREAFHALKRNPIRKVLQRFATPINAERLWAGDVVLVPDGGLGTDSVMMCVGKDVLFTNPDTGVLRVPRRDLDAPDAEYWRVTI